MNLKSYLRGLGLGMIVTTIILVIAFKARNHEMTDQEIISRAHELGMVETSLYAEGNETNTTGAAKNENIVSPTADKGEVSGEGKTEPENTTTTAKPESTTAAKPESTTPANKPESTTPAKSESTTAANKPESTTPAKPESTTVAKPESTTAAKKPESTTAAKPESTTPAKPESTTPADNGIVLVFENISTAEKATRILYEAGVIQDMDSFNQYLSDNGYARKIGEGEFTFTSGMSFEEIAKIITYSR